MKFDLSRLGWKAFQDLACAVAADVLKRPVQSFLDSNDGGRDGAFIGKWQDSTGKNLKSTIQCKFMGKPGATLTLAGLKRELPKAKQLAASGFAEDYIILTNAGVSGEADQEICAAFEAVGVEKCRVFGGSWIIQQLTESARLRMLVPRVYGIGDLTHIITGNAYKQAKSILDNMGSDLSCFVPTDAYRQAVEALHKHGFVILLGDPASGKSTIAAILALGGLDDGCIGALKINAPDQLNLWHPGERQFLWVDDAFGSNQFDLARMSRWNAELGTLRAAIENGARIVFTSRNYIWEAAKSHLKSSAFPLLKESQVVVNVQELSENERAQMLYNHVRRVHPRSTRQKLKPFLPAVAANKAFLPETARRLGDPLFTNKLELKAERLQSLVEHPVEFLTEILGQLDHQSLAAVALIFLNSETGVPSPIGQNSALEMVNRLLGVQSADVARAMQHLNDSLTRLSFDNDGARWVFRHPTVTDAFAELVSGSPELIELYVHGAKLDRLIREVVCAPTQYEGAHVRVPSSLFPALLSRLEGVTLDESIKVFLGARCSKDFLSKIVETRSDILDWAANAPASNLSSGSILLLAALSSYGLMPEASRSRIVREIKEHSLTWLQARPLENKVLQQIFTVGEFKAFTDQFRNDWLDDLENLFERLEGQFSSGNELELFEDFKDNMTIAERFYYPSGSPDGLSVFYSQIDARISELQEPPADPSASSWPMSSTTGAGIAASSVTKDSGTIFDDIDD